MSVDDKLSVKLHLTGSQSYVVSQNQNLLFNLLCLFINKDTFFAIMFEKIKNLLIYQQGLVLRFTLILLPSLEGPVLTSGRLKKFKSGPTRLENTVLTAFFRCVWARKENALLAYTWRILACRLTVFFVFRLVC